MDIWTFVLDCYPLTDDDLYDDSTFCDILRSKLIALLLEPSTRLVQELCVLIKLGCELAYFHPDVASALQKNLTRLQV